MGSSVSVFVEIPYGSSNKYEFDIEKNSFKLDRVLYSPMYYPAEYGEIPQTLAEDGDPLDALVLVTHPTFSGCIIDTRIIGALTMADEKGKDDKLIGVPVNDPRFANVNSLKDISPHILEEIKHFFETYKDLEKKQVKIDKWEDKSSALKILDRAVQNYGKS
ncbi:inorganic pyrophosphatase [Salsuginibacillus halophilus]|uniref:Inorganic pyrophosphatase n=1 Tax=Salsuginibacillus halophilus TaxID=517424 RepID=A0A2P8HAL6_9BACI|nr:inorganic diphosphatase [Salsuginibacillus halophilus]PSL43254.1 inorganic pyrophosphatase [Salsuginibacillus halophilus]